MKQSLMIIMLLTGLNTYAKSQDRDSNHYRERKASTEKRSKEKADSFIEERRKKRNMAVSY